MNVDGTLANRALAAVGEPSLKDGDKTSKSFLLVKKFYLSTMLESLERVPWTSGRKRARLERDLKENLTDFSASFKLPIDCGKIIELKDKSYYIVEGRSLYTDSSEAVLLYVTNGRLPEGTGNPADDFPDYNPPEYEALFYQVFELRLACKFALELSGKPTLHQTLLQEASMLEEAAYRNTKTLSAGRKKGVPFWID